MSTAARVNETAESICSALFRTDFQFMGETDSGRGTWFTRGTKPRIVNVEVERQHKIGQVDVIVTYPNISDPRQVTKGRIQMTVFVAGQRLVDVQAATEACVVRVLEVFKDVLAGSGVAGPITR